MSYSLKIEVEVDENKKEGFLESCSCSGIEVSKRTKNPSHYVLEGDVYCLGDILLEHKYIRRINVPNWLAPNQRPKR
jgi:hypothetical protein